VYFIFLLLGGSKAHDYRTLLFLCSEVSHFVLESKKPNKLFKSDSARVAFLLCVGFSGEGGMRRLRYCAPHTLTRRYATQVNLGVQSFGISPAIRFELSANEHFYPQIHG
jgi:hypothetical protein